MKQPKADGGRISIAKALIVMTMAVLVVGSAISVVNSSDGAPKERKVYRAEDSGEWGDITWEIGGDTLTVRPTDTDSLAVIPDRDM
jgi:hypothetical protein